jgi:hypothetical protein
MNLTEHFRLVEFTRSETATRKGLDNTPDDETIERLKILASGLEEVRELLGVSLHITSGYRSIKVNSAIGSASTSQHVLGEAADFTADDFGTPQEVCRAILDSNIAFDKLIYEDEWTHISFTDTPRRIVLTAHFGNGQTTYTNGIA